MEVISKKYEGWYFSTPKVDYFFITDQKKKSDKMLSKMQTALLSLGANGGACNINSIYHLGAYVRRAVYQKKYSIKWGLCHDILGDDFGAGDFESNKHCEIIVLQ